MTKLFAEPMAMTTVAKTVLCILLLLALPTAGAEEQSQSFAECLEAHTIDHCADQRVEPVANAIASVIFSEIPLTDDFGVKWIVVWLACGALFFTFYLGFINIRGFKHALNLVRGKYADPNHPGEVSHFQALTSALSGTVGLGNIAGVAVAITLGGPGATFWMIVAGFLGMSSKFAECTLGVKYRMFHADGSVSGGPKYYLTAGLSERGLPNLGKVLATIFAICCIGGCLGAGNMFQSNQAFSMMRSSTGGDSSFLTGYGWLFGIIISILVGVVVVGGIKSIGRVTSRLVPFMAAIYVFTALLIIFSNITQVPAAFGMIIGGAFSPEGVAGGIVGVVIQGFQRATFSNEAGVGSAAIAHAAVKTDQPATEGYVALLEPFIDTVVICTMTALVIIITGAFQDGSVEGVAMTSLAFTSVFPWFKWILTMAVILFAFSTMLSWFYYGSISWQFLFGRSVPADYSFKLIFCVCIVIGASASLGNILTISDSAFFSMSLANLLGLYILAPVVKQEVADYQSQLKSQ